MCKIRLKIWYVPCEKLSRFLMAFCPSFASMVETFVLWSQGFTGYRSWSLHLAGITLYFMSGLEARYYFAINFILYRTVSQRQRDLSFWHLSAFVAQTIRDDSLAEKLSVASVCFKENDTSTFACIVALTWVPLHFHPVHNFISVLSCMHSSLYLYFFFCVPSWHNFPRAECRSKLQAGLKGIGIKNSLNGLNNSLL